MLGGFESEATEIVKRFLGKIGLWILGDVVDVESFYESIR